MTDFFSVLGEARRPWIDPAELKQKFISLSAENHPDRNNQLIAGAPDFAAVNAAYQCLRVTPVRLAHLLELETGAKPAPVQNIPNELMDWAFEVGGLVREVETLLKEKARNSSPMVAVQYFEKLMAGTDRLNAVKSRIQQAMAPLDRELQELNVFWTGAEQHSKRPLDRLSEIHQRTAFLNRWQLQLDEAVSSIAVAV
jgi:curved DNA-binding protein CbpA